MRPYNTAYQTGVAEGASIYAAAGDQGASICTNEGDTARDGIGVNAFASTPYNVAVGGTDFERLLMLGPAVQATGTTATRRALVIGQILHTGNSMEQQLRQPV